MSSFEYEPLATLTTIRLVQLPANQDTTNDGKLQLIMTHREISEVRNAYYALSYVWGNPDKVHTISLNGRDFGITANLMHYLQRSRSDSMLFWIDAICINQIDDDERSGQILHMAEIFQSASTVYADLGPASDDEQRVAARIKWLAMYFRTHVERLRSEHGPMRSWEHMQLPAELVEQYNAPFWECIDDFFSRPWWTRVWVMQEATALRPERTNLLYGHIEVTLSDSFDCFHGLDMRQMRRMLNDESKPKPHVNEIVRMYRVWSLRHVQVIPLLEVMIQFQGLRATDPRDIVYAALNIANDGSRLLLLPDYKHSLPKVYMDASTYLVKTPSAQVESLDILSYCGTDSPDLNVEPGWPSWVPRWERRLMRRPLNIDLLIIDNGPIGRADSPLAPKGAVRRAYPIEVKESILLVYGLPIDKLVFCSRPCIASSRAEEIEIVESWFPTDPSAAHISDETRLDAFLRTVVADRTVERDHIRRGGKANWNTQNRCFVFGHFTKAALLRYTWKRRLAGTHNGYIALVSHQAEPGDMIYALFGGSVLYVLRPEGDKFLFVGECYVDGFMDGEALELLKGGQRKVERVSII